MSNPTHYCAFSLLRRSDAERELALTGDWVVGSDIPSPDVVLGQMSENSAVDRLVVSARDLGRWDTLLMTFLIGLIDHCRERGIEVDSSGLPEGARGLLTLVYAVPERAGARRQEQRSAWLAQVGKAALRAWEDGKVFLAFLGEAMLALGALFRGRARFRQIDLWLNIQDSGPSALAIVTVISLLVGLILAFVGAVQLALFGAQIYIADLVGLGMLREMGALMTGIIMSGRTGAAFAAQLGTMNVNSEIDALRVMGLTPMELLVLPRMLALILIMPLLCLYADLMGIVGGALVTVSFFDVSLVQYLDRTKDAIHLADFLVGVTKCAVFGVLIAIAGCLRGIQCGRSASAVGDAATSAVVTSIVYIVVADSVMTLICNQLGI